MSDKNVSQLKKLSPVTAGVKTDFDTLMKKFKEAETVRYEKFAEIWRNMRMSLFCSGRQNERIIQEFMEECFVIATKYLTSTTDLQVRVFGLYLLYGLYVTQPCIPKVKIRILPQQWHSLMDLQKELHEQQHFDVECVLHKLRYMRVFYFVITETDVWAGMSSEANKDEPADSLITDNIIKHSDAVDDVIDNDFIEQLASIHDQYYKTKCALSGTQQPNRSLDVMQAGIMDSINLIVAQHNEKKLSMKKHARSNMSNDATDADDSDDKSRDPDYKERQSVGYIRSKIRERAFTQVHQGRKMSRLQKAEAELSPKKETPAKRHSSLKLSNTSGSSLPDKDWEENMLKKPRGRQPNKNLFYGFPEIESQMSADTDASMDSSADDALNLLDMMIVSQDDDESSPESSGQSVKKKAGRPKKKVNDEDMKVGRLKKKVKDGSKQVGRPKKNIKEAVEIGGSPKKTVKDEVDRIGSPAKNVEHMVRKFGMPKSIGDKVRKVGRPKKNTEDMVKKVNIPQNIGDTVRKVGRPKKNIDDVVEKVDDIVKKKVGRPKKNIEDRVEKVGPKRKVGRPRKNIEDNGHDTSASNLLSDMPETIEIKPDIS